MKKFKTYKIDKLLLYISDILKFFGTAMMFSAMISIFLVNAQGVNNSTATLFFLIFGTICILLGGFVIYIIEEE